MRTHDDATYQRAVDLVIDRNSASVSMIQRHLRIGYAQASGYLEEMQALRIVSGPDALGRRKVLTGNEAVGSKGLEDPSF